jgi:DNA (cytosine-5)-methyltransferase 1
MTLTLGELCAGYGGLGKAVENVFDAELKWYSEFDAAPSRIMAHHWPGIPNLGDMTAIDWASSPKVDVLSGGTPCQDLSHAGRRKGMTEGTRSNLWVQMREAIATIQPAYVVWENVRGAYSARADSEMEPCPGCLGIPRDGKSPLRALGRVLGDLSELGFDAEWRGIKASDVGAPHNRYRVLGGHSIRTNGKRGAMGTPWRTKSNTCCPR